RVVPPATGLRAEAVEAARVTEPEGRARARLARPKAGAPVMREPAWEAPASERLLERPRRAPVRAVRIQGAGAAQQAPRRRFVRLGSLRSLPFSSDTGAPATESSLSAVVCNVRKIRDYRRHRTRSPRKRQVVHGQKLVRNNSTRRSLKDRERSASREF